MIIYYKDGAQLVPIAKETYSMLFSAAPGVGKTQIAECLMQAFLCGESALFKTEGCEEYSVLRVDTEQPADILENSNNRILNYCKDVDPERYVVLPLVTAKNAAHRWEIIKKKVDENPKIKLIILDNLSGLCNAINSDIEASSISNFINSTAESKGAIIVSLGHVANDGTPLGHVGKGVNRHTTFSANMHLDRRHMITFVNILKSRLSKAPNFTFLVDQDGNTKADIYMPFPAQ